VAFKNRYPNINYTSRDFNTIRRDLIEYAKRYYPNSFQDFSEAGFGSLMVDSVAYIGDILSFYLDYNVNESFLDTATEYNNIVKLGNQMGFKFPGIAASFGTVDLYVIAPANSIGASPDTSYMPILKRGTAFSSTSNVNYALLEDVNFADTSNEVVVARVDSDTGNPTHFAIKSSGQVISGLVDVEEIEVGNFQRFLRLEMDAENITEIISVTDAQGNEYYEVDYLSQDVVYRATTNRGTQNEVTQASLRPFAVPRRFVIERNQSTSFLQFGYGTEVNDDDVEPLIDPSKAVLKMHGKDYYSDANFDPYNLLKTDKLGVAPSNTTLSIVYRSNTSDSTNDGANSIVNIVDSSFEFPDEAAIVSTERAAVVSSLEVNNPNAIVGQTTLPSSGELKERIYNVFSTQNRAVTQEDYKVLSYSMPTKFGSIKRAAVKRDPNSFKRNLNLYILSEDVNGNFVLANSVIKENLKNWLNSSRMINDAINILDAKIVNLAINFTAVAALGVNKFEVLTSATEALQAYYSRKLEIGEPFYISDVYSQLNKLNGIVDVTRVKITHKSGENYSSTAFDINEMTSDDGMYINAPDNVVFEVKFPSIDIKGTIK
jgi:phage-related baseplate assembly protein